MENGEDNDSATGRPARRGQWRLVEEGRAEDGPAHYRVVELEARRTRGPGKEAEVAFWRAPLAFCVPQAICAVDATGGALRRRRPVDRVRAETNWARCILQSVRKTILSSGTVRRRVIASSISEPRRAFRASTNGIIVLHQFRWTITPAFSRRGMARGWRCSRSTRQRGLF